MPKRIIATLGAAVMLLAGFVGTPATAGTFTSDVACTSPFTEDTPNPEICVRVYYEDFGATVELRSFLFWMRNPRSNEWEASAGYKVADFYIRCHRDTGEIDYFFTKMTDALVIQPDTDTVSIDPANLKCKQANVRYDGVGILAINLAPDRQDDFGPENGYNTL